MNRADPDRPILGVGGIAFSGDRVLLVRRGREPGKGEWSIPGGAVELGETLKQAVVRELKEETGVSVRPVELVKTLERIFRNGEGKVSYHYILFDFLCELQEGTPLAASDADDASFIPLDLLPSYHVASITMQVIRCAWDKRNSPSRSCHLINHIQD
jgi:ADP-ribose pyrophosphatase YjhB (NUDIX family)